MIAGVGVDIVKINRFSEPLTSMVLGYHEMQEYEKRGRDNKYIASRFAAKEAFLKALGMGVSPLANLDLIQVVNDEQGKPHFAFSGWIWNHLNKNHLHPLLSISDDDDVAVAYVVIEKRKR
jgi:holo-[acyl-carrier protein] synthase